MRRARGILRARLVAFLAVLFAAPAAAEPSARLIHFTADGTAEAAPLRPDFPHHSVWNAMGADAEGRIYVAVSNHVHSGGDVALYRIEPGEGPGDDRVTALGTLSEISGRAGNWMPGESQMKVHTFLSPHADGRLWFASMDYAPTEPLRGAHLYALDPATGEVEDLSASAPTMFYGGAAVPNPRATGAAPGLGNGVLAARSGIKGMAVNPALPGVIHFMTFPEGEIVRHDIEAGGFEVVGTSSKVSYIFHVDDEGDVYYADRKPRPQAADGERAGKKK